MSTLNVKNNSEFYGNISSPTAPDTLIANKWNASWFK